MSNIHTASESKNLAPNKLDLFNLFAQFLAPPIIESIVLLIALAALMMGALR